MCDFLAIKVGERRIECGTASLQSAFAVVGPFRRAGKGFRGDSSRYPENMVQHGGMLHRDRGPGPGPVSPGPQRGNFFSAIKTGKADSYSPPPPKLIPTAEIQCDT